jgi:hypothetical protein
VPNIIVNTFCEVTVFGNVKDMTFWNVKVCVVWQARFTDLVEPFSFIRSVSL